MPALRDDLRELWLEPFSLFAVRPCATLNSQLVRTPPHCSALGRSSKVASFSTVVPRDVLRRTTRATNFAPDRVTVKPYFVMVRLSDNSAYGRGL